MLDVAILGQESWPGKDDWEALAKRAVGVAFAETPFGELRSNPAAIEISIKLSDDAEVRTLNAA